MKKLNQTKAIRAKCKDCIHDELAKGRELEQITACSSTDCALWEWRPLSTPEKLRLKKERVASMSPKEKEAYKLLQDRARNAFNS